MNGSCVLVSSEDLALFGRNLLISSDDLDRGSSSDPGPKDQSAMAVSVGLRLMLLSSQTVTLHSCALDNDLIEVDVAVGLFHELLGFGNAG